MLRGLLALACVCIGGALLAKAAEQRQKGDLAIFQDFLKEKYKDKKWQIGPSPIETPELKQAFPNLRFYYVFTAPPARTGDLQAELKRLREEELKRKQGGKKEGEPWLSLTVAIDNQGKLQPLASPADFKKLLPAVNSHVEANTTAALILTLYPSGTKPSRVLADDVSAIRDKDGWSCSFSNREVSYSGGVQFNPEGEVVAISKYRLRQVPP